MLMKINDCDYAIDGLRECVFLLCCPIYQHIQITDKICKNQLFRNLGSIWSSRELKRLSNHTHAAAQLRIAHEAAAHAIASPVDLTEDIGAGDSDSNAE